jgi:hypothetical protein
MIDSNKNFQQQIILQNIEIWVKNSYRVGAEQFLGEMFDGLALELEEYPGLPADLKPSAFFKGRLIKGFHPRTHKVIIRMWLMKIHRYIDDTTTKSLNR